MHVNNRHHSLAIAQGPRNRMHHLMMEFTLSTIFNMDHYEHSSSLVEEAWVSHGHWFLHWLGSELRMI